MAKNSTFAVVKSYRDGCVSVSVNLSASGYGPSVKVQCRAQISTIEARELAAELIAKADAEEAKQEKLLQTKERHDKWREREIAAGRIKVMSASDVFGRR